MDNSIEAYERNVHSNNRIKVRAFKNEQGVFIYFENNIEVKPEISNGRLATSKVDKRNHGIGVFSIENTVNQYGGEINISMEDNKFLLFIWIPNLSFT